MFHRPRVSPDPAVLHIQVGLGGRQEPPREQRRLRVLRQWRQFAEWRSQLPSSEWLECVFFLGVVCCRFCCGRIDCVGVFDGDTHVSLTKHIRLAALQNQHAERGCMTRRFRKASFCATSEAATRSHLDAHETHMVEHGHMGNAVRIGRVHLGCTKMGSTPQSPWLNQNRHWTQIRWFSKAARTKVLYHCDCVRLFVLASKPKSVDTTTGRRSCRFMFCFRSPIRTSNVCFGGSSGEPVSRSDARIEARVLLQLLVMRLRGV